MSENKTFGFCSSCGKPRSDEYSRFCMFCGAELSPIVQSTPSADISESDRDVNDATSTVQSNGELGDTAESVPVETVTSEKSGDEEPISLESNGGSGEGEFKDQPKSEESGMSTPIIKEKAEPIAEALAVKSEIPVKKEDESGKTKKSKEPKKKKEKSVKAPKEKLTEENGAAVEIKVRRKSGFVFSIVLFLVSAALLVLAFFPFAYSKLKYSSTESVEIGYSNLDTVSLATASFYSYSPGEIMSSASYAELESLTEGMDTAAVASADEQTKAEIFKCLLKLSLVSEDEPPRATTVMMGALSLLYISLCFAMLIAAFVAFIRELVCLCRGRMCGGGASKIATSLLWLVTALLPLMFYMFSRFTYFGNGTLAGFSSGGTGVSWGMIASALAAVGASLVMLVRYAVLLKKRSVGRPERRSVREVISLPVIVILVLAVFALPVMSIQFAGVKGDEVVFDTSYMQRTEIFETTDSDVDYWAEDKSSVNYLMLMSFADYAAENEGDDGVGMYRIYNITVTGYARYVMSPFYIGVVIVTLLLLMYSGLLFWSILRGLLLGSSNDGGIKALKLLLLLATVADLALSSTLVIFATAVLDGALPSFMLFGLGIGPIAVFALSVFIMAFLRLGRVEHKEHEYDDPDVSYAPYVI